MERESRPGPGAARPQGTGVGDAGKHDQGAGTDADPVRCHANGRRAMNDTDMDLDRLSDVRGAVSSKWQGTIVVLAASATVSAGPIERGRRQGSIRHPPAWHRHPGAIRGNRFVSGGTSCRALPRRHRRAGPRRA